MEKKCYVVIHTNYADGPDAYVFWSEADAKQSVREDMEMVIANLRQQGYGPVMFRKDLDADRAEVFIHGGNIYYEWHVIPTTIR